MMWWAAFQFDALHPFKSQSSHVNQNHNRNNIISWYQIGDECVILLLLTSQSVSRLVGRSGRWKLLQVHRHQRDTETSLPSSLCLKAAAWISAPISSDAQTSRAWRKTAISTWKRAKREDKPTWSFSSATAPVTRAATLSHQGKYELVGWVAPFVK